MKIFSDISIWWLIPLAGLSFAIAFYYYRNQKQLQDLSKVKRMVLTLLRSLSIVTLILILFGIMVESKESKTEKPVFINLIDNSMSMINYKDSNQVAKQIDDYRAILEEKFGDRFDIIDHYIDDNVQDDSMSFRGVESDLSRGFDHIYNHYYNRNIGGICFISDGNFNRGQNPLYSAERIGLTPVFTLGVGDTLVKRDQLIKNIAVNQIAFLGNEFPVEISLEAAQYKGSNSRIEIIQNGKVVASKEVRYINDQTVDFQQHTLTLKASGLGFVNYQVRVTPLEGEITLTNNSQTFFVEVLNARSKALFLVAGPHPDITAVKQVMSTDDRMQIEAKLLDDWNGELKEYDLILLHGLHKIGMSSFVGRITSSGKPIIYFIDNQASNNDIAKFGLSLQVPSSNSLDEVQGVLRDGFSLFETSDELDRMLQKAPPLKVRFGTTKSNAGNILISQRIGKVEKSDPLLMFGKTNKSKYGVFVGEGIWKWKLNEYRNTKGNKGFNELIQKTTQYLLVKGNKDPLRIILPKRFKVSEEVLLTGEFYNESLEPITSPDIALKLTDEDGKLIKYEFAKRESNYHLNLGKLKSGKYSWIASTKFNGKSYTKKGEFVVEDINIEKLVTRADFALLRQLSVQSNGEFNRLANYNSLINNIDQRKDIVNIVYEESSFKELIDMLWLFILLIFSLSLEWFLRRFSGSY